MTTKKSVSEMSQSERDLTEMWFVEARSGLTADLMILESIVKDASVEEKSELRREKGRLANTKAMVERGEEEFFTDQTTALNPPTQTDIEETKRLTEELGAEISAAKASQAAMKLVGDLGHLVTRVLQ